MYIPYIHGCYGYIISVHRYKSDSVASLYSEIMPYCVNVLKFRRKFSFGIRPIIYRKNLKNISGPNFKTLCNVTYYLIKFILRILNLMLSYMFYIVLIYYVPLLTLYDLMLYTAMVHTLRPPGRRGDYIFYGGVYYLWALGTEFDLCHASGS
jgi:hypothetical protein